MGSMTSLNPSMHYIGVMDLRGFSGDFDAEKRELLRLIVRWIVQKFHDGKSIILFMPKQRRAVRSRKLYLGIMGAQLRVSLKPLGTIVL